MKKVVLFLVGSMFMVSCGDSPAQVEFDRLSQRIAEEEAILDSVSAALEPLTLEYIAFNDSIAEADIDYLDEAVTDKLTNAEMAIHDKMRPYETEATVARLALKGLRKELREVELILLAK